MMVDRYISILMMSRVFGLSIWTVFILIRIIRNFDNKFAGVVKILVRYYHVFLTE